MGMGHYNQKTTLSGLNIMMAFTKRKLRESEFENSQLKKEIARLQEAMRQIKKG